MKCPACFNSLTEVLLGGVRVDVCQNGCGGVWFDAFEMQRVAQQGSSAEAVLLHTRREAGFGPDPQRKRECPRCEGIKLHRHFFSARRNVQVDECPSCGGYWLDAGELSLVRQEMNMSTQQAPIEESTVSSEFIRYLYRLKTAKRAES